MSAKSIYTMTEEELETAQRDCQDEISQIDRDMQKRLQDLQIAVLRERLIAGVMHARMQMRLEQAGIKS